MNPSWQAPMRAVLAVGLVATIWLSLMNPGGDPLAQWPISDKIKHAAAYACLGGAAGLAYWSPSWGRGVWLAAWLALAVFGMGLEIAQAFHPARSFSLWDQAANCAGAATGLAGAAFVIAMLQWRRFGSATRSWPALGRLPREAEHDGR